MPLGAQSGYYNKNQACSSRVLELPDVAENLLRATSEGQQGAASEDTIYHPSLLTNCGDRVKINSDIHVAMIRKFILSYIVILRAHNNRIMVVIQLSSYCFNFL